MNANDKNKLNTQNEQGYLERTSDLLNRISSSSKEIYNNKVLPFVYSKKEYLLNRNVNELISLKDLLKGDKKVIDSKLKLIKEYFCTNFPNEENCCLLGNTYSLKKEEDMEALMLFYWSRITSTYKTSIPKFKGIINKEIEYESDSGWGCTYRTGQSLVMQSLVKIRLDGLDDCYDITKLSINETMKNKYLDIIGLFLEKKGAFSLENMVGTLSSMENNMIDAGQFIGPSTVSNIIKNMFEKLNYNIYLNKEGVIYRDQIKTNTTETLILLSLRLGVDKINTIYYQFIKKCLQSKFSVGIIGGSGSSSFYYVGYVNSNTMLYYDPHIPKEAISTIDDVYDKAGTETSTSMDKCQGFHYLGMPKTMDISKLDPNITLGFVVRNHAEFEVFCEYFGTNDNITSFFEIHPTEKSLNQVRMDDVIDFDDDDAL